MGEPTAGDLWNMVAAALEYHRKARDRDWTGVLNRLCREWIGAAGPQLFTSESCNIVLRNLAPADIERLEVRHNRARPARKNGPIVVLECSGRSFVIDGGNRVNAHRRDGDSVSIVAFLITPRA